MSSGVASPALHAMGRRPSDKLRIRDKRPTRSRFRATAGRAWASTRAMIAARKIGPARAAFLAFAFLALALKIAIPAGFMAKAPTNDLPFAVVVCTGQGML